MKEEYNLKQVIDESLKNVIMTTRLEDAVKDRCDQKQKISDINQYKILAKVAVWMVGVIVVLSGTVYAMRHMEGFSAFMDEELLGKLTPYIQPINKENGKGDVKLVVEAAITDRYNSALVFSFINEGEEPWREGIEAGEWDESWTVGSGYGPPVLSEDGRKLTYYVESHGSKDMWKDKNFKLKASNLIRVEEVEETVDIPLGNLFDAHGIVVNIMDYDYPSKSKYLYMKLDRMLKKEIGASQRLSLKEEPSITFEYVGMIQDSKLEDPHNPDGGLTIYTRNASDKYWTDSGSDYVIGHVSEVMDLRTGEVYEATLRATDYDVDTLWRGSLGVSQFRDIMDPSMIPYLKATKVTYTVQEVVEKDNWQVEFKAQDTTTIEPISTDLTFTEGGETIHIEQVDCSVFGVTMQGTRSGKLENPKQDSIYEKLQVAIQMQDGTIIPLEGSGMRGDKHTFIANYIRIDEQHNKKFILNIDQVEAIMINDQVVAANGQSMSN